MPTSPTPRRTGATGTAPTPPTAPGPGRVRPVGRLLVGPAALVVLLSGCSPTAGTGHGEPAAAPTSQTSAHAAAPEAAEGIGPAAAAALESLLLRREAALAAGDRAAYAATVADPASRQGRAQLEAFDTAVALGVTGLSHDPELSGAVPAAPHSLVAVLRYRVAGTDTADRTATVTYRLARAAGQWRVATERPTGQGSTAPWLAMPGATVRRGEHAVAAGTVAPERLTEVVRAAERARADLGATWDVPGTVLLLAPSTAAESDVLLGRPAGGAPVAATTEGPVGPDGTATGDRVVLDPDAFARLTPAGRQVVVAHELAHVAVRATVPGAREPWVSEGWADHVGYGYAGQPVGVLAAPLLAAVREGRAPRDLPGAAEVDPAGGDIEVAYLGAWQAVELLVDRHGEDAVRRFVVAASSTGTTEDVARATDRALRDVLGTSREDLTRDWLARLTTLSR